LNKQPNFQTYFGGFLSLVTSCLYIFFIYDFSSDFIFRKNPDIQLDKIFLDDGNKINITDNLFLLAIRDHDEESNDTDFIVKYIGNKHKQEIVIDLIKCDKTPFYNNLFLKNNFNPKKYNCLDLSKIKNKIITNLKDLDISNKFIKLDVFQRITNIHNISEENPLLKFPKKIDIIFPETYFNPNEFSNPLNTYLFKKVFISNPMENNAIHMFIASTTLVDDQGFIFSNPFTKTEIVHTSRINNMITNQNDLSPYRLKIDIYADHYQENYSRKYIKIQDVFAQVFGIMDTFRIMFGLFISFGTAYPLDYYLVDRIVDSSVRNKSVQEKNNIFKKFSIIDSFIFENILTHEKKNSIKINLRKNKDTFNISNINNSRDRKILGNTNLNEKDISDIKNEEDNYSKENDDKIFNIKEFMEIEMNTKKNNEISINLIDKNDNVNSKNQISVVSSSLTESINNPNDDIFESKKKNIKDLKNNFTYKNKNSINKDNFRPKNSFPKCSIFEYYCNFFYKRRFINSRYGKSYYDILDYFIEKINEKIDIFYYIRLVKKVKIFEKLIFQKEAKSLIKNLNNDLYQIDEYSEE